MWYPVRESHCLKTAQIKVSLRLFRAESIKLNFARFSVTLLRINPRAPNYEAVLDHLIFQNSRERSLAVDLDRLLILRGCLRIVQKTLGNCFLTHYVETWMKTRSCSFGGRAVSTIRILSALVCRH